MEAIGTFALEPKGPFSVKPARRMACGFLRGSRCEAGDAVRLAFPREDDFTPAGVSLTREGERLVGRVFGGGDVRVVARQVARALAVDVDGTDSADGRLTLGRLIGVPPDVAPDRKSVV